MAEFFGRGHENVVEEGVEGCGELASDLVVVVDVELFEEGLVEEFADVIWVA